MFDRKAYMQEYDKKIKEKHKIWIDNNREKIRESDRRYYKENIKQVKEKNKRWALKNYIKIRRYKNQWQNDMRKIDLKYNLNSKISHAIGLSLKGNKNGRNWETLVGYSVIKLKKHLQKTMPKGYTWQDFLSRKLHIDHIIPINVFNFTEPEHTDFRRCWALKNLQLLSAEDNLNKGAKLTKPFQPALKI